MPCGWEGNRRSGITLAMRHRLQWFIHLQAHGLRKGDEHRTYALLWSMAHLPLPTTSLPNPCLYNTPAHVPSQLSESQL